MPQYFITHVEPLHQQKGQEALFFIREQDPKKGLFKSHYRLQKIPHYFFTRSLPNQEAQDLLKKLKKDPKLKHLAFQPYAYNQEKTFLKATGSKEDCKILPHPFFCSKNQQEKKKRDPLSLNSPSQLLQWFYPPFLLLKSPDNLPLPEKIHHRKYASLESILNEKSLVLDIEIENWQTGQDHIFMNGAYSEDCPIKKIYHDFPFPHQKEQEGFQLIYYPTQEDLGGEVTLLLHQEDPLWIFGHNIMTYDHIKLKKLTKKYLPAVNFHYPITKASPHTGLGKVLTKGRFTLDTYRYVFHYFNLFANNKLETIAEFEKSLTYDEQAHLAKQARGKNKEAFQKLVHYCIKDLIKSHKTAQSFKERVTLKSQHFRKDPNSLCATSKFTVADNYYKRRHFLIKNTFQDAWKTYWKEEEPFSLDEFKQKFLPRAKAKKKSQENFQAGYLHDTHVLYLTPFLPPFRSFLNLYAPSLLEKMLSSSDPLEKFDLAQTLNAHLSYLVEETKKILAKEDQTAISTISSLTDKQKKPFHCLFKYHGFPKIDPLKLVQHIKKSLDKTNQALKQYQIINTSNYFHFLSQTPDFKKLEKNLYGLYLGSGPALSLAPQKIIANPFAEKNLHRFVYQGFSLERGRKCNFEIKLLKETIQQIFREIPFSKIKKHLASQLDPFLSGNLPFEEYFLPVGNRTYYKNELEGIIEKSTLPEEIKKQYSKIKKNISQSLSPQTTKVLDTILEQSTKEFSYSVIQEYIYNIKHPFPPKINLVYADNDLLLPQQIVDQPYREMYRKKLLEHFQEIFSVLKYSLPD